MDAFFPSPFYCTPALLSHAWREANADYGITQQQLADATGISVRTIISIEKGHRFPTLLSAMRIANYFSLSVEQLFEYKNINPIPTIGDMKHE